MSDNKQSIKVKKYKREGSIHSGTVEVTFKIDACVGMSASTSPSDAADALITTAVREFLRDNNIDQ